MTMITPSYLGETIEYSSLHACRSTLEDPTTVYATEFFGGNVYAIDGNSLVATPLYSSPTGNPWGVDINPATGLVYVASPTTDSVDVLTGVSTPAATAPNESCSSPISGSATCTITLTSPGPIGGTVSKTISYPFSASIVSCQSATGGLNCGGGAGSTTINLTCLSLSGACQPGAGFSISISGLQAGPLSQTISLTPPGGGAPVSFLLNGLTPTGSTGGPVQPNGPTATCTPAQGDPLTLICTLTLTSQIPQGSSLAIAIISPSGATIQSCALPTGGVTCGIPPSTANCGATGCASGATIQFTVTSTTGGSLSISVTINVPNAQSQTFALNNLGTFSVPSAPAVGPPPPETLFCTFSGGLLMPLCPGAPFAPAGLLAPSLFRTPPAKPHLHVTIAGNPTSRLLSEGCTDVLVTSDPGTSLSAVAALVIPSSALSGIWRFDNASRTNQLAYSPTSTPSTTYGGVESYVICVGADAHLSG